MSAEPVDVWYDATIYSFVMLSISLLCFSFPYFFLLYHFSSRIKYLYILDATVFVPNGVTTSYGQSRIPMRYLCDTQIIIVWNKGCNIQFTHSMERIHYINTIEIWKWFCYCLFVGIVTRL